MQRLTWLPVLALSLALGACAQKSAYEAAVEDLEPVYCYQSLGGVACYEKPDFRDERRLVNYFGPAPLRYDRPEPAPERKLFAPEQVNYWVKDVEPVPQAAPQGDLADRPWVGTSPSLTEARLDVQRGRDATRGEDAQAFLRRIEAALARANRPAEPAPENAAAKP
ncbi:MAG: hypothetical protein VW405_05830 [Rhodospirillaceae bacterium]